MTGEKSVGRSRLCSVKAWWALALALAVNVPATVYTARSTLQAFPNSGDEYAYLLSARLFAGGRLSVPSPEPAKFFSLAHVINDGRFFGKYPPGWPLALTLGVWLDVPWLVNPLLGALTLIVIFVFARRFFSLPVANAAMLLSLLCPFFIFESASFFSHPLCLLFVTLAAYFLFAAAEPAAPASPASPGSRPAAPFIAGLAAGAAFLARPYTAVAVLLPLGIYVAALFVRRRDWRGLMRLCLWAFAAFSIMLGLFFLYNFLQTGSPFRQPFVQYEYTRSSDHMLFTTKWTAIKFKELGLERWLSMASWTGWCPLLLLVFLAWRRGGDDGARGRGLALAWLCLILTLAYLLFPGTGWAQYGPRYLYEIWFAVLILAAVGLLALGRAAPVALAIVLALNGYKFAQATHFYGKQVAERTQLFKLTKERKLDRAVVFVSSGINSMHVQDLPRNGLRFDGPVLFARDLGPQKNRLLLAKYPDRRFYTFWFDYDTRQGRIEPYWELRPEAFKARQELAIRLANREPRYLK